LAPWLDGHAADITVPVYDRSRRQRIAGGAITLPSDTVLILEGVPALLHRWETARPVRRLYVESQEAERRLRVIDDLVDRRLAGREQAPRVYERRQLDEAAEINATRQTADDVLTFDEIFNRTHRDH